jgi:dTDP-4-amino-4,6-dideoxygalactose transaminase
MLLKVEVYSPTIRRKEMDAVLTAMVEDRIGPGEQAKFLIQIAREKLKFEYCLALRSPAFALNLALKSLALKEGDGVLVSALSPLYYEWVIRDLQLTPIYCDVLPSTVCLSRETVENTLASKSGDLDVKCIVLHHALGYLSDVSAIAELGIPVIEDHSQSYGTAASEDLASDDNTGLFTILGLEEKDMLTSGGGALFYSLNRRGSRFSDIPLEYGLPDMNAAMAVIQFREAEKNLLKRREIADLYSQAAQRTRHRQFIHSTGYNNYAFPLVLEKGMKDVKTYARRKDIAVDSAFENTLAGSGLVPQGQCPEAYSLSLRTVLFPIYPRLSMADAGKVAKLILTLP